MNIFKKILTIIFNPLSLIKSEKNATNESVFFQKHAVVVVLISIAITALLIFLFVFSGLF